MQIGTEYSSLFALNETEESEKLRRQKQSLDSELFSPQSKSDRVSISDEARRLSEAFQRNVQDQNSQTQDDATARDGAESTDAAKGGGAAGGSGAASDVDAIKEKIKKLQAQMAQVATSDMPEEQKQSKMAALNSQIQELSEQLAQAEQQT